MWNMLRHNTNIIGCITVYFVPLRESGPGFCTPCPVFKTKSDKGLNISCDKIKILAYMLAHHFAKNTRLSSSIIFL